MSPSLPPDNGSPSSWSPRRGLSGSPSSWSAHRRLGRHAPYLRQPRCEPFSTYPRTYDLIHADGINSLITDRVSGNSSKLT